MGVQVPPRPPSFLAFWRPHMADVNNGDAFEDVTQGERKTAAGESPAQAAAPAARRLGRGDHSGSGDRRRRDQRQADGRRGRLPAVHDLGRRSAGAVRLDRRRAHQAADEPRRHQPQGNPDQARPVRGQVGGLGDSGQGAGSSQRTPRPERPPVLRSGHDVPAHRLGRSRALSHERPPGAGHRRGRGADLESLVLPDQLRFSLQGGLRLQGDGDRQGEEPHRRDRSQFANS